MGDHPGAQLWPSACKRALRVHSDLIQVLGHYDQYVDMSDVQSPVRAQESAPRLWHRGPSPCSAQQTTGGCQTVFRFGTVREFTWASRIRDARTICVTSNRVFADAVIMSDALRLAIHLPRTVEHKLFMKVASDRKHVTHVAKLHAMDDLESMKPFLREAYEHSIS
jgi:hypothetical protein